ncbi:MAG: FHA domain-containing protein [Deltaproteobacteria bacterium]|nr:FHA domain-containing protein [Deltaproteobacteria bacterium]
MSGDLEGRSFSVGDELLIGRDRNAVIRLPIPQVSRRHARVVRTIAGEWVVEDLGSRNGTTVNGKRIKRQQLKFGDRIQVGGAVVLGFSAHDELEEQVLRQQRMEAIGRLAEGVSHDFKNLLAVMLVNLQYLQESADQRVLTREEIVECVSEMRRAVEQAVSLTDQMLNLSATDHGERQSLNISALIKQVMRMCRRTFPKNIQIFEQIEPSLNVIGNSHHLQQVMMNLCIRARDQMPEGGQLKVDAGVGSGPMLEGLPPPEEGSGWLVIRVRDTGPQMDEEARRRVFEPLKLSEQRDVPHRSYSGLALSVVYSVVRNHGGSIRVPQRTEDGTNEFQIFLPLPRDARAARRRTQNELNRVTGQHVVANPVLLLGVREGQEPLAQAFAQLGCSPRYAGATDALDVIQRDAADLVVVFIDLPALTNGKELCRAICSRFPELPVIVGCQDGQSAEVLTLLAEGVAGYLPRPYDHARLKRLLESVFRP